MRPLRTSARYTPDRDGTGAVPRGPARGVVAADPSRDASGAAHTPWPLPPVASGADTDAADGTGRPGPPAPRRGSGAARHVRSGARPRCAPTALASASQPVTDRSGQPTRPGGRRQRSAEPVTHHPRLVEAISRDTGNHQLTPMRKASPELAQELGGAVRRRSVMWGVLIRSSPRIKQGKHLM